MSTAKKDWKSRKINFIDWVYAQRSGYEKYFTFSIGLKD